MTRISEQPGVRMRIEQISQAIQDGKVLITDHADEEAENDHLAFQEIADSVMKGETIEDYPDDHPYPSYLILGFTQEGSPIHSVWAYNSVSGWAVLVTVYRPDPDRWVDWRKRKKP